MTFLKDVKNSVSVLQILNCRLVIVKKFVSVSSNVKINSFRVNQNDI